MCKPSGEVCIEARSRPSVTEQFLLPMSLLFLAPPGYGKEDDALMARPLHVSDKISPLFLEPLSATCLACGKAAHIAYHTQRTVTTLEGRYRLQLLGASMYPAAMPTLPSAVSARSGRDMGVAAWGIWVGRDCARRVPAVPTPSKPGRNPLTDRERLQALVRKQGYLILAVDGLRPDVGHEVLWVVRDCVSGEILLARALLSEREADLTGLLKEVQDALSVPVHGVISDGQHSIRNAVATAFPGIPHQLCHFHYLREAAKPFYEADRHAKKELKKQVRGIRPIERLSLIVTSLERVAEIGAYHPRWTNCIGC